MENERWGFEMEHLGFEIDQSYGRGVPPIFTTGVKAKKGYTSDQGYGRGVGGTPNLHHRGQSQKRVYL